MAVLRLLDLLVPPACAACGLPGRVACAACLDALRAPPEPLCGRCGHPAPLPVPACPECTGPIGWARQAVVFQEPADSLVRGLKDGRRRALAAVLAGVMATRVCPPEPPCPLVPVPVGRRRRAERGFDQAEMIARELGRRWARPVEPLLVRVREGPDQRGASASARVRQVARAFAVHPRAGVMPESAILVDDVHTTGATLAACARALRSAGVRSVGAVCFARALAGRPGWRG